MVITCEKGEKQLKEIRNPPYLIYIILKQLKENRRIYIEVKSQQI